MPLAQTFRQRPLMRRHDRRRFQRVKVNLLGRFMLEDRREYPCQTADMSPGSAALMTPVTGRIGERVVVYIDHIGRIEGEIVRIYQGGFAMTINATLRKKDKLAAKLTWLANRHELNLPEDRRHDRVMPANPISRIALPDGREFPCRVIDLSLLRCGPGRRGPAADRLAGHPRQAPGDRSSAISTRASPSSLRSPQTRESGRRQLPLSRWSTFRASPTR